ncbi:MAG: porin family protein [Vicingaceae bacterium]
MKHLLSLVIASLMVLGLNAQKASVGLQLGMISSDVKFEDVDGDGSFEDEVNEELSGKVGFRGGLAVDVPLGGGMGLRFGLLVAMRSWQYNYNLNEIITGPLRESETGFVENVDLGYLELPINFVYSVPLGENQLQGIFGFTPAFGLWGNRTEDTWTAETNIQTGQTTGEYASSEENVIFGAIPDADRTNDFYLNPFDIGVNVGMGYLINDKFLLSIMYTKGLSNVIPFEENREVDRSELNRIEWRNISLSATIFF